MARSGGHMVRKMCCGIRARHVLGCCARVHGRGESHVEDVGDLRPRLDARVIAVVAPSDPPQSVADASTLKGVWVLSILCVWWPSRRCVNPHRVLGAEMVYIVCPNFPLLHFSLSPAPNPNHLLRCGHGSWPH